MAVHQHQPKPGWLHLRRWLLRTAAIAMTAGVGLVVPSMASAAGARAVPTPTPAPTGSAAHLLGSPRTPIKHVIVIIGENHSFDNTFATYQPPAGQTVDNLLSEGIVNADGSPGPNAQISLQRIASDAAVYQTAPPKIGSYGTLPPPGTTSTPSACDGGQAENVADSRFPVLGNDPFQITKYVPYDAANPAGCPQPGAWVGSPVHRFYQMWQESDHNRNDQFAWTETTASFDNGVVPPTPITEGAVSMGFYNVATGDAPLLASLAQQYAMSDNYHQAQMGGTGVDHYALGTGDFPYYQNAQGQPTLPPAGQIENPNPKPGTNNSYIQDGYSGGSYTNCSDPSAPGVASIDSFIDSGGNHPWNHGDCAPGAYYLLNNYNPA